jgi:gas vesicle protein
MKVKDTIANFLTLAETLKGMKGKQHPRLIVIGKINLDRILPVAKRTFEQREAMFSPAYKQFEEARDALIRAFCDKHQLPHETQDFGDKQFELENEILALTRSDAHKDAVEQFNEDLKGYDETLGTEIELELQPIDLAWLPKKMNLVTFIGIRNIVKDANVYHSHELEKIDLSKGEIISIVQKVLGDGGHFRNGDKGRRPVMDMVFATPVVRRIASFMESVKDITKEFAELRNKHTRIPEFALFMETRNAILREENTQMEEKIKQINEAYSQLGEETKKQIEASDTEVGAFSDQIATLEISKLRLDDFDENIDTDILTTLFPLIRE